LRSGESFCTARRLCSSRWESLFIRVHPWLKLVLAGRCARKSASIRGWEARGK
jgi:hypothetical protein